MVRRRLLQLVVYWAFCWAAFYLIVIVWRPEISVAFAVLMPVILLAGLVLWRRFPREERTGPDAP